MFRQGILYLTPKLFASIFYCQMPFKRFPEWDQNIKVNKMIKTKHTKWTISYETCLCEQIHPLNISMSQEHLEGCKSCYKQRMQWKEQHFLGGMNLELINIYWKIIIWNPDKVEPIILHSLYFDRDYNLVLHVLRVYNLAPQLFLTIVLLKHLLICP